VSPAPVTAPRCPGTVPPAADVDGDGCPERFSVDGARMTVDGIAYDLGRSGDLTAVADWDCDGRATPALLRPSTGEVFVFDAWARLDQQVTVSPLATVAGATGIRAGGGDPQCPDLVVTQQGRGPLVVEVPP
jgi:hypothetical protein